MDEEGFEAGQSDWLAYGIDDPDVYLVSPRMAAINGVQIVNDLRHGGTPPLPADLHDPYYEMFLPVEGV